VIPLGDEPCDRQKAPVITLALIAINVLIFLYEITLDPEELSAFFAKWAAIPADISRGEGLVGLVTSQFLHGGLAHIGGNMLFLWVFGDNIEDTMGHIRFIIFYLLTGVIAGLAQVAVNPDSMTPLVGASGAISGILGAYIVLFPLGKIRTAIFLGFIPIIFLVPAWYQIGVWILIQFVNGFFSLGVLTQEVGGGVAFFAHIGGFLAGAAGVWLFRDPDACDRQRQARARHRAFERMPRGT
jgi:membrane associated rhomboid family serine protease